MAHGKPMSNTQLVEHLCSDSATLSEARRQHIENFEVLIPHVFMTDVLARVGACLADNRDDSFREHRNEAAKILQTLERGLAEGERETRNVIAVSFVNDGELEGFFNMLRPLLGPRLLAQLQGK